MVVDKEGTSSGLEGNTLKKEAEMSEAGHQTENRTIDSETDSKLVRMDGETRKDKEPELGDGEQKTKDESEMKVLPDDETKGQDPLIGREGGKEEKNKKGEEGSVKEGGLQSMIDAKQAEKLKKLEKSQRNFEKEEDKKEKKEGEEGKKEKKEKSEKEAVKKEKKDKSVKEEGKKEKKEKSVKEEGKKEKKEGEEGKKEKKEKSEKEEGKKEKKEKSEKEEGKKEKKEGEEGKEKKTSSTSGHPEGEKKKEKKDKKSKSSSERILKKLEKLNAKIDRILAKKEEYELRLKEAQERERVESEKAALQGREVSSAVTGKSTSDSGPGLRSEGSVVVDGLKLDHDASQKELIKSSERGSSGSLSRTASLIEVTPAVLMEEVSSQKRVVEKFAKLVVSDSTELNAPSFVKDSDVVMTGKGEVLKHALQVDDSKVIGTS